MYKDPTEFRERVRRWRNGEQVYDKGRPILPAYGGGKDSDQEYYEYMERLANKKAGDWAQIPLRIDTDATLTEMLNDNTYNYRSFYDNDRYLAEGMLYDNPYAHFSDSGKTVYHPTFSSESMYSGVRDKNFNPEGKIGGVWSGNTFYPNYWQKQYRNGGELNTMDDINNGFIDITEGGTHEYQ